MPEPISRCRACDGPDLVPVLDLGVQPLPRPWAGRGRTTRSFALVLNLCRRCAHGQLAFVADAKLRLAAGGGPATHSRAAHLRGLAEDALARCGARRVLDVGCGDGALLAHFQELGCEVAGVDPCRHAHERARERGLSVLRDVWSLAGAALLSTPHRFDLVTATDVLDRVDEPVNFLRLCLDALTPDGTIVVEVPYLADLVERGAVDRIDPTRVSCFTARSFTSLAKRAGLEVTDVVRRPEQGGVVRFFLRRARVLPDHGESVHAMIRAERAAGLLDVATYEALAARLEAGALALRDVAAAARVNGRKVAAYGLTTRRLLLRLGLAPDLVLPSAALDPSDYVPSSDVTAESRRSIAAETGGIAFVVVRWLPVDRVRDALLALRALDGSPGGDTLVLGPLDVSEAPLTAGAAEAAPEPPAAARPVVFACPTFNVRCRAVPGCGGAA